MVKFWGSLGELVYYKIKGNVYPEKLDQVPVIKTLKDLVLFKI